MDIYRQLRNYVDNIEGGNKEAAAKAEEYARGLLKIPMSLGRIEEIAFKLASITGKVKNDMPKKCIIVMSADNGVTEKGVSAAPKSVTMTMTECFSKMVTGVGVTALAANADLIVYDIGTEGDVADVAVINKKIRRGTADFSEGPAMSAEECCRAILVGIEAVRNALDKGYQVIGTGEMGIGNTSSSSCVTSVLTNTPIDAIVGKGTGMADEEAYENKVTVLKTALERNKPDPNDIIDVISKVGGLDIAGLVGVYIGCAYYKVPAIIDGYISAAAALCAWKLNQNVFDYMFESHESMEPGYSAIKKEMNLRAMFDMNMRLGEGSGCPLTFFVIDCANLMMNRMYTFEQGMISSEYSQKAKAEQLQF